jgi:hypothetical protein
LAKSEGLPVIPVKRTLKYLSRTPVCRTWDQFMKYYEGRIYMTKKSNHSQDYDRKHGNDHNVKDKAALKEEFIDNKRNDAGRKDTNHSVRTTDEGK